jgi:hypothetical protein
MFPSGLEPIPLLMGSFQSDRGIGNEMVKITGSGQRHRHRWMSKGLGKRPMRFGRNHRHGCGARHGFSGPLLLVLQLAAQFVRLDRNTTLN